MKLGIALGIAGCFSLAAADTNEMVPPAGPGVFTAKQSGPGTFKLVVAGHTFTSRGDIEKYLAYRAARLTIEQGAEWFTFKEDRGKGDTAEPVPVRDPEGPRYSFRMKYFRPVWRYKVTSRRRGPDGAPSAARRSFPPIPRPSPASRSAPRSWCTRARWTTPIRWPSRPMRCPTCSSTRSRRLNRKCGYRCGRRIFVVS